MWFPPRHSASPRFGQFATALTAETQSGAEDDITTQMLLHLSDDDWPVTYLISPKPRSMEKYPMNRFAIIAAGTALLLAATPSGADAQQSAASPLARVDTVVKADTGRGSMRSAAAAADSAAIELARAAMELASNVEKVVKETANDPAVRLAAIQAAGQAVALAQSTLADHLGEIEKALAEASRALGELAAKQTAKSPQPPAAPATPAPATPAPATPAPATPAKP